MSRYSIYMAALLAVIISSVWLTGRNQGQEMQTPVTTAPGDIASWTGEVFVLQDRMITKLNARLEVVKSVHLPASPLPEPTPPDPIPKGPEQPVPDQPRVLEQIPSPEYLITGRICADPQKVCVLYNGVIYTFDHELNFMFSRAQEY